MEYMRTTTATYSPKANLALHLPRCIISGDCQFVMHSEEYKKMNTQIRRRLCLLALKAAFHQGVDPVKIYVRSRVHNSTSKAGHWVPDAWHVTASIKTASHFSDEHQTFHCYTDHEHSTILTTATSTGIKQDTQFVGGKEVWPCKKKLTTMPTHETPTYMDVRHEMIMESKKEAHLRMVMAEGPQSPPRIQRRGRIAAC